MKAIGNHKLILPGVLALLLLAIPVFAATNYALNIYVFDDATSAKLGADWIRVYDSSNQLTSCAGTNIQSKFCSLPGGTYTLKVFNSSYTLYTNTFQLATATTKNVYLVKDGTAPTTTATLSGTQGENGWYTSSVTVTLTCSDAGSGCDKTEYRLNNGAWTTYSTAVPISTEGTTTFDYRSTDKAGNTESTQTKTIKIDTAKPTAPVISAWTDSNKAVSITAANGRPMMIPTSPGPCPPLHRR